MIRTSVMSSMEGRSIGYVNIFLFIVYFTYIIIGGVVFMWLEKPEEERVCSIENERYQNIARLQNLSLKIENEVDTSLLTDNDDSMTIQRALSIVDNGIGEMEYLTGQRRKRQAHWDTTWELRKLENITKNYDVDNYRVINEEMTYTEAVSRCEFLGDWAMTSTTSMDELIFLHHKVLAAQPLQLWLRLKETGATPCDTTCWAWKKTTFSKYNRHVSSWKRHPNFRYKNCHKQLPTICKRTKPKSPCEGNTCPKGSVCALDSRQDKGYTCQCDGGQFYSSEKNLCVGTCPIGYAWGRPYANPGEETEFGCFDIDECEEGVHQCQEPFICLNRRGDYICSCPYQIYKRSNGELICQKQSLWGPVEEPAVDCDFTDSTNRNCNPDHRNKTTEEEEDIMALIKKHKIPVEEVSKSEKPRPAQINPYNSNAQKISEYFTQEEVASKYGNYSGIGKLSGEISYKATRQRGFPNFPTKLEFHTALKEGFVQDSVWHAAQRFFKDMPSYERSAASQLAKIEEFMISAEVTLWKMRKGHTTSRFVSENPENGANQIDAINKLFLKNETYGKSALLVGNAIINFEQGTIVTEVAMSKGHKPSRKQLKVVKHKSEESGDIEESIVIVDKDKADEIEGLKSEVRNASEVITNKTATIVVKTEQVHLTREELLQTRIALMDELNKLNMSISAKDALLRQKEQQLNFKNELVKNLMDMVPRYSQKATKAHEAKKGFLDSLDVPHPSKTKMVIKKDGTLGCPNLWSYRNAFFFTGTIGTTIGYGNVYPTTSGGKIFCVFYALTSIPLFGFFMGKIGDTLKLYMSQILISIYGKTPTKRQAFTIFAAYVFFGSLIFSIIPAVCFHFLEGWEMLNAWYFTIITLTTVGFGDYVPAFQQGDIDNSAWLNFFLEIYRTIVLMWMLAGLAWLGGLISMISESLGEVMNSLRVGPVFLRGRTPSVEADLVSQQDVAFRGARDHLLDNIPEEEDPECKTLNSEYDDSPDAARKIYKKSAYHPKTSWKGTRKEDL